MPASPQPSPAPSHHTTTSILLLPPSPPPACLLSPLTADHPHCHHQHSHLQHPNTVTRPSPPLHILYVCLLSGRESGGFGGCRDEQRLFLPASGLQPSEGERFQSNSHSGNCKTAAQEVPQETDKMLGGSQRGFDPDRKMREGCPEIRKASVNSSGGGESALGRDTCMCKVSVAEGACE